MADTAGSPTGSAFGSAFDVPFEGTNDSNDVWSDEALATDPDVAPGPEPAPEAQPQPGEQQQPQPQAPSAPEQSPVPQDTPQPQPQQVPQQPPGQQPPAQEGQQPEGQPPAPQKWADRFDSPEQLVEGYKGLQGLQTRTARERAAAQREAAQYKQALEQVLPAIEQMRRTGQVPAALSGQGVQPQPGAHPQQEPPADFSQMDPQQVQAWISQQIDNGIRGGLSQVEQRTAQQMQVQTEREAAQQFVAQHPDAAPGTPLFDEVESVITEFQTDANDRVDPSLFSLTQENLELAYELGRDAELRQVMLNLDLKPTVANLGIAKEAKETPNLYGFLMANPLAVDTPEGLNYARQVSGVPAQFQQAAIAAGQQQRTPEQQRLAATVETGGSGAPVQGAPGAQPTQDDFDLVVDEWNKGADNVFGLHADF